MKQGYFSSPTCRRVFLLSWMIHCLFSELLMHFGSLASGSLVNINFMTLSNSSQVVVHLTYLWTATKGGEILLIPFCFSPSSWWMKGQGLTVTGWRLWQKKQSGKIDRDKSISETLLKNVWWHHSELINAPRYIAGSKIIHTKTTSPRHANLPRYC